MAEKSEMITGVDDEGVLRLPRKSWHAPQRVGILVKTRAVSSDDLPEAISAGWGSEEEEALLLFVNECLTRNVTVEHLVVRNFGKGTVGICETLSHLLRLDHSGEEGVLDSIVTGEHRTLLGAIAEAKDLCASFGHPSKL